MEFKVDLRATVVVRRLLLVIFGLIALSLLGRVLLFHFQHVPGMTFLSLEVYLDEEANLPTLYSSLALSGAAFLLAVIARLEHRAKAAFSRSWKVLSWIFLYIAIDELLSLHEMLIWPLQRLGFSGFFHYAWVVPAIFLVALFVASFAKFLWHLSPKLRMRFILAGTLFVVGGLGFEMLNGNVVSRLGEEGVLFDPLYQFLMTMEEGLEMLGVAVFIHALLGYLNQRHGVYEMRLGFPSIERASKATAEDLQRRS